jgi:hypothetical protein
VQKKATLHAKEQGQGDEELLDEGNQICVVWWAPASYHSSLQNNTWDGRKAVHWESTSLKNVNVGFGLVFSLGNHNSLVSIG